MARNADRDDRLELEGEVIDTNKGIFKVMISEDHIVVAKLNGRLKIHEIRVIVGDRVTVEVSPYNVYLGRISQRHKPVK